MKKDHLKDYATNAFRSYAAAGRPSLDVIRQNIIEDIISKTSASASAKGCISRPTEAMILAAEEKMDHATGRLQDLIAVINTIEQIKNNRQDSELILNCLEMVYFPAPHRELERNEISERVAHAALTIPCAPATVYRKLRLAREVFAVERGLNVESSTTY